MRMTYRGGSGSYGTGGKRVWRTISKLWEESMMSRGVKKGLYERVIRTVVYGYETWSVSTQERRKIEEFERMLLRSLCRSKRGQSKKLTNKREVRVECAGKSGKERAEMLRACGKKGRGKIG